MKDKELADLSDIDKKIEQLKRRKHELTKQVEYKTKNNYRKERARRLIETGALAEKYFELNGLSISDREELFKMFSPFVTGNKPKKFKVQQKNEGANE
ncbi:hypothetical protein [Cytobacillus oceanisediminis]|uniref:hypothetical protein n=1 Tax=Cytobacillus oceanisediminis TaxID=665099 RepID=UPI002040F8C3|nr:hypothetical protein [Cytobacillus oceanisediminis]MCM3405527.1 hypothetical protein [Cytobacillus oceanisediminis]